MKYRSFLPAFFCCTMAQAAVTIDSFLPVVEGDLSDVTPFAAAGDLSNLNPNATFGIYLVDLQSQMLQDTMQLIDATNVDQIGIVQWDFEVKQAFLLNNFDPNNTLDWSDATLNWRLGAYFNEDADFFYSHDFLNPNGQTFVALDEFQAADLTGIVVSWLVNDTGSNPVVLATAVDLDDSFALLCPECVPTPVPLPSTLWLLGLGSAILWWRQRHSAHL